MKKSSLASEGESFADAESAPVEPPRPRWSLPPMFNPLSKPGAIRPPSKAPPPRAPGIRKSTKIVASIALGIALIAGGWYGKQALHERSPAGRVHQQLLAWQFAPPSDVAAREAAFAELDRMGAVALPIVIDKLADASPANDGASRSTRTMQMIAHDYLMYVATRVQTPPPQAALEVANALSRGQAVDAQWLAARDAWRPWVSDLQSKGFLPQ